MIQLAEQIRTYQLIPDMVKFTSPCSEMVTITRLKSDFFFIRLRSDGYSNILTFET